MTHSCNCMYGPQDSRCCINRARRAELEDAYLRGREGRPLDDPGLQTADMKSWLGTLSQQVIAKPCGGDCGTCVEPYHGKATTNT